jgi:hypothetical protein
MKYISQPLPQKLQVNEIFSYYEEHFEEDFTAYYQSYAPDTVVILVNVENTVSVFTESYLK